ncbi:MAG: sigma-70 family RNA polymerase sigma factor [Saprospiraceae bacterium]|nr:sigma-70 family RNA polymerase sigma factor [Saprospiraceae bacterium]
MELTDQQIIEGLNKEDPKIYKYLYLFFGPKVIGYALKNSGSRDDGEELLQTTLLKVWKNVTDGKYKESGKFNHYFFSVAANSWHHVLRSRKRQKVEPLSERELFLPDLSEDDIMLTIVREKRFTALYQAFEKVGELCRTVMELFYLQNTPLKEIAEQQQVEYGTLRKRIFDCRNKLKRLTEDVD